METMRLTDQQCRRIADLPENCRVVGVDRGVPFVREPAGQFMRIQQDGHLAAATVAAKGRLADRRVNHAKRLGRVMATSPYTRVMD